MTKEQLQILFDQRQAANDAAFEAYSQIKPDVLDTDLAYRKALHASVVADDAYLAAANEFINSEAA